MTLALAQAVLLSDVILILIVILFTNVIVMLMI